MMEMQVRLERLQTMRAAYVHVLSASPEEDAQRKILEWAKSKSLLDLHGLRLFGRNTYPTENPEPHGYEYYLTIGEEVETGQDGIETRELPGGLYAVLRFTDLTHIRDAWKKLWLWIEQSDYAHAGLTKGEHGWVDGFEEHVNWHEMKPPTEWVFDLWVQLKEMQR